MAPAAAGPDPAALPSPPDAVAGAGAPPSPPLRWAAVAAVVAVVAGAGILLGLRLPPHEPSPRPLTVRPLTATPGRESQPAVSPDGRHVAFVWSAANRTPDLYVRPLAQGPARRLTRDAALEGRPAWSPDGRRLAFGRLDGETCTLRVLDLGSGRARSVGSCEGGQIPQLDWSADGASLVASEAAAGAGRFRLSVVSLEHGERRSLTAPGLGLGDRFPAVSPDGRRVAFARTGVAAAADLWVVPLAGGTPRRVTRDGAPIAGLAWSGGGKRLVYSADRGGGFRLWTVAARGGEPRWLALPEGEALRPSLAGGALVFEHPRFRSEIWRADGDAPAAPLLPSTRWDAQPAVSPDGRLVAFASDRSGAHELWVVRRDGSAARQLTRLQADRIAGVRWVPDGGRLALSARHGGQSDLFLVDAATGAAVELAPSPANEVAPAWSGDGGELFFLADRGARWGVWRQPLDGREAVPVTPLLASALWAAADGRSLYASRFDREGIWRVPLGGGAAVRVDPRLRAGDFANWGLAGRRLFFVDRSGGGEAWVRLLGGRGDQGVALAAIPAGAEDLGVSLAPDGEVLFARSDRGESDLLWVAGVGLEGRFNPRPAGRPPPGR